MNPPTMIFPMSHVKVLSTKAALERRGALTVLKDLQDALGRERVMALGVPDILVQTRLHELFLLLAEPCHLLREVGDGEVQNERDDAGERSLCQ